jgi:hypothetical protein
MQEYLKKIKTIKIRLWKTSMEGYNILTLRVSDVVKVSMD